MVTCVCPTSERRREFLPQAIEYFQSQTYASREMLIVVDPGYAPALLADSRIRVIEAPAAITLGAKRNFACENAGELIAHWDDDDFSAPGRLADQVARLIQSDKAVTGYARMRFTDGRNWWRYADPNYPLGTSLLFRRTWWNANRFPDRALASDGPFISQGIQQRQLAVAPCGEMMFARIHPDSTNKQRVMRDTTHWQPCESIQEAVAC